MSIKIHSLFNREEVYLGIKSNYTREVSDQSLKHRLKYVVIFNNITFIILYTLLSGSFSLYIYFHSPNNIIPIVSGSFLMLYLMAFLISLFYSTMYLSTIIDLNLLDPLKSLPISKQKLVNSLTYSWLVYNGFSTFALTVPAAIIVFFKFHSLSMLTVALIWTVLVFMFGYSLGLILSFMIASKSMRKKSKKSAVKQVFKALIILFVVMIWQVFYLLTSFFSSLFGVIGEKYQNLWFVFPFAPSYSVSYALSDLTLPLILILIYGALIGYTYIFSTRRMLRFLEESYYLKEEKITEYRHSKYSYLSPTIGYFLKTLHFIGRKPQLLISFVVPVAVIMPTFLNVMSHGTVSDSLPIFTFLTACVFLPLTSLSLFIAEGKSFWIVSVLPISKKRLVYYKSMTEASLLSIIIIVTILILLITLKFNLLLVLLEMLIVFFATFSVTFVVNMYLASKLKDETSTITSYTLGGNVVSLILMIIAACVAILPAAAVAGITFFLKYSSIQEYLIDLAVYLVIFFSFYYYLKFNHAFS